MGEASDDVRVQERSAVSQTMTELFEVWIARYGLGPDDRSALSLALVWAVRGERRMPPMPIELAEKIGHRTFVAATNAFLLELFGWTEENAQVEAPVSAALPEASPVAASAPSEPPPPASAPRPVVAREKRVRKCSVCRKAGHRIETCPMRRESAHDRLCSGCGQPGHRLETCAERPASAPNAKRMRPWRGYSAAGDTR